MQAQLNSKNTPSFIDSQVDALMPLVHKVAHKVSKQVRHRVDFDELVSLGIEGLLQSLQRYDPTSSASLATFSYLRIRGNMLDGIGKTAPLSRNGYRLAQRRGELTAHHAGPDNPDLFPDHSDWQSDPEMYASRCEERRLLAQAMAALSSDERYLMEAVYVHDRSLQDAAFDLNKSRSWACRKHASIMALLRAKVAPEPSAQTSSAV